MGLLERISKSREPRRSITTLDDYVSALNSFVYQGNTYGLNGVQQTMGGEPTERIGNDLVGYATGAYMSNGPVFSCMLVRQLVFSAARFRWQRLVDGAPSRMFGSPDLGLLEEPWQGGTTQDLLSRVLQYADLAGNSYSVRDTPFSRMDGDGQSEIVTLRPDWVEIALMPRMRRQFDGAAQVGWKRIGYLYHEGGKGNTDKPAVMLPEEVGHFAPIPDPLATYRGMSWLTPVIREIRNDRTTTRFREKFFENAATPNMIVKVPTMDVENFKKFKAVMDAEHGGWENAFKRMYLGGGADVEVVGLDFEKMQFDILEAAGEVRIASAAGVPPIVAGMSKGLDSATYSNYGQARRRFADGTIHPLWQNVAGSFAPLLQRPPGAGVRLWYDASDVPFLREDEKDAAEIQHNKAVTIRQLVDAGYKPESVVTAVEANDFRLLEHSGLYSVQLQPAGAQLALPAGGDDT